MTNKCKHQFDSSHPYLLQCIHCTHTVPIFRMKNHTQEEFKELFPSLSRPARPIIIDKLK